jgi:hypothetical protein
MFDEYGVILQPYLYYFHGCEGLYHYLINWLGVCGSKIVHNFISAYMKLYMDESYLKNLANIEVSISRIIGEALFIFDTIFQFGKFDIAWSALCRQEFKQTAPE